MTDEQLLMQHRLKGTLEGQSLIASSHLDKLKALKPKLESEWYRGYATGQMDMLAQHIASLNTIQESLDEIIKEGSDV